MNKRFLTILATCLMLLCACDDDTANIGIDVMPQGDAISASTAIYDLQSETVQVDSVFANTSTCYLGCAVDPEMRVKTTCNFLAQFHLPADFLLPKIDRMVTDDEGNVVCDSCLIRINIDDFYGDSLTTMKVFVQELDKNNVMEESQAYYTNIDASKYVDADTKFKKSVTYAITDLARDDDESRILKIKMPAEYGALLMRQYYDHPEYFTNSYQFLHNVCPGFYFKSSGGVGSIFSTSTMALDVYFRYCATDSTGTDSIVDGMQRFGATQEVIQNTHIDSDYPGSLTLEDIKNEDGTYVKTPTGLFTEVTLPISEIVAGEHYTDSINQAKITLRKYNSEIVSDYALPAPDFLLLVRKSYMNEFFENCELPNSAESFLSNQYSSTSNAYQFSNISQLVTNLRIERDNGAGVEKGDDEATRNAKYAIWEAENPDWNKVMIIPVEASYSTTTNSYYGTTSTTLRSVRHYLGLSSARLEGSSDNPLQIEIVYSRFNR